jgi:SAM-dependent methyltransferase
MMTGGALSMSGLSGGLASILACPRCHAELKSQRSGYVCRSCGDDYPQTTDRYLQFLPSGKNEKDWQSWQSRQDDMHGYYQEIVSSPSTAPETMLREGAPLAPLLARFTGRVLDIGGGSGLMRVFAPHVATYVVVEPETYWFEQSWQNMQADHRADLQRTVADLVLVQGVGEYLPFRADTFDAAMCLWSLNHAQQPSAVLGEAYRVLRASAPFTIVLEDMEPGARDILDWAVAGTCRWRDAAYLSAWKLKRLFAAGHPWYVGPDHVRITEAEVAAWTQGRFTLERRHWIDRFLVLEFRRC